jgi:MoaA/NifB/PqqE/SkfB family radical SAM enzyme
MSEDNITKADGYRQYNMKEDQALDSWNSEYMKNVRLKMIAGEEIVNCKKCVTAETQGLQSMRKTNNKEYYINSTNRDGSVNYYPKHMELHFGNTCNLHCKMCSQQFSHVIGKELLKMGEQDPEFLQWVKKESGVLNNWTGELDISYDWYKNDRVKKSIFEHVSNNVEQLIIIGGEPTIIKEFYELLEYCYKENTLKDKTLTITTNMTNTNKNLSTWLGSVKSFVLHASIDGLGERNKYIRFPCEWTSVLSSIEFYKIIIKKYNNGQFNFAPAIQLLNIDQLPELCEFFIDNFISTQCSIAWVSQVRYPIICDYAILPTEYKLKIVDKFEMSAKKINHKEIIKNLLAHADDLRKETFTEQQKYIYQSMFIKYNDQQDQFRKKITWRQLLPALEKSLIDETTQRAYNT